MKALLILFVCMSTLLNELLAENKAEEFHLGKDFKQTLNYLWRGSYLQFTRPPSWVLMGVGTGATAWALEHDDRLLASMSKKEMNSTLQFLGGTMAVVFNFPVVPVVGYWWAKSHNNSKLKRFSLEYAAALYLSLIESGIMSHIHVHRRPESTNLNFWEEKFRGDSSFPSGHVMPFAVLTFKAFQFYGPWAAIFPAVLTGVTAFERVNSKKHFFSDTVAGIFIAGLASEGVRIASGYDKNHPWYQFLAKHNVQVGGYKSGSLYALNASLQF